MEDFLKDYFHQERLRAIHQAPVLKNSVLNHLEIMKKQRRRILMSEIAGGVLALAGVGVVVWYYAYNAIHTFFTGIAGTFFMEITDVFARLHALWGNIQKATQVLAAWPLEIWYLVALSFGILLLLKVDRLIRAHVGSVQF